MNRNKNPNLYEFFASCPVGIESCLEKEIKATGIKSAQSGRGGVSFNGEIQDFLRPLLSSRVASRFFMQIAKGKFKTTKDLDRFLRSIEWEKYLHFKQTFRFKVVWDKSLNEELKNSLFWAQKSKDALVDRMRDRFGQRPNVETKEPDTDFLVRIDRDKNVFVLVDLCGAPLHQRGYRDFSHRAPLKENLAAGFILLTNWDSSALLMDPMCGSGTILTEAFLCKYNISPQILHLLENKKDKWSFQKFYFFRPIKTIKETYDKLRTDLIEDYKSKKDIYKKHKSHEFIANDQNAGFVKVCQEQFKKFEAVHLLSSDVGDALELKKSNYIHEYEPLVIMTNPPYGERLGEVKELEEFYYKFGEMLKNSFTKSSAYILSSNPDLRKKISLKTKSKTPIFNGPIECRILHYELF